MFGFLSGIHRFSTTFVTTFATSAQTSASTTTSFNTTVSTSLVTSTTFNTIRSTSQATTTTFNTIRSTSRATTTTFNTSRTTSFTVREPQVGFSSTLGSWNQRGTTLSPSLTISWDAVTLYAGTAGPTSITVSGVTYFRGPSL